MITNQDYLKNLVRELTKLPYETEWVEFKVNNIEPQMIGEYISALSNSATLFGRTKGYLVWGIEDKKHEIVGTDFDYRNAKKGNEELESWLTRMLTPRLNIKFHEIFYDELKVVVLEIPNAEREPTKFSSEEYIRIGSNKKNLKGYPEKERRLWQLFDNTPFELHYAKENIKREKIFEFLNYIGYYNLLNQPIPKNEEKIIEDFINEKFIVKNEIGNYNISNLGALLISKDFKKFDKLSKKNVRVIWYKKNNRLETIREQVFSGGYAVDYENIINYILTIIPQEEIIVDSIRKSFLAYPEIAIRELVANILIHQALDQTGTSPMIELFENRIEFSNLGAPLVPVDRVVDTVPISRNENIAGFMHKCGICEERESGYDKVIDATNKNILLAPKIENQDNNFTKVTLYSKVPFELIKKEDKIRTCYMLSCLKYVSEGAISNSDVREVFGFSEKDKAKATRIIKDTLNAGLIKIVDKNTAPRYMKYIPFWG